MIGAAKGYRVIITVTEKISKEKFTTLKAYGAHVVVCPCVDMDNPHNYHQVAVQLQKSIPNSFMPNQYFNLSNRMAHQTLLAPEIWEQTEGKLTHFFAAAGTSGTISGVGRFLKSKNPDIKVIAIDAQNSWRSTKGNPKPYAVEGIGIDFNTPVTDYAVIDEFIEVSDENALGILQPLAQQYGLLVGLSSGAVAYAAQEYGKTMKKGDIGVMIFGDSGRAYLSKGFYGHVDNTIPCAAALTKTNELFI
jgi:cystathionine beta-synthase